MVGGRAVAHEPVGGGASGKGRRGWLGPRKGLGSQAGVRVVDGKRALIKHGCRRERAGIGATGLGKGRRLPPNQLLEYIPSRGAHGH